MNVCSVPDKITAQNFHGTRELFGNTARSRGFGLLCLVPFELASAPMRLLLVRIEIASMLGVQCP
jgi:hypothetical protein